MEPREEFEALKSLLSSDQWPPAVHPDLICDLASEADKTERAETIVEMLLPDLGGKTFLDFGCGEGHAVTVANRTCKRAIGYDLDVPKSEVLTDDFEVVRSEGPYDFIMLNDVLDHAIGETPEELLLKTRSVCHEKSVVVVRCHPFICRHGGHLYRKLNKAYAHLIFTDTELLAMGLPPVPSKLTGLPYNFYRNLFSQVGFAPSTSHIESDAVEPFFTGNRLVSRRIHDRVGLPPEIAPLIWIQIDQSFHNYRLMPSDRSIPQPPCVGAWDHMTGGTFLGAIEFYEDGRFGDRRRKNSWRIEDGKLCMRWQDAYAPGGYWEDHCVLTDNGYRYRGRKTQGRLFRN